MRLFIIFLCLFLKYGVLHVPFHRVFFFVVVVVHLLNAVVFLCEEGSGAEK